MTDLIEQIEHSQQRLNEIAKTLPANLPEVTKYVMAGDLAYSEDVFKMVRTGRLNPVRSLAFVGSYARLEYALRLVEGGLLGHDNLVQMLPDIWPGCDPDDSDPRFLALWQDARRLVGKRIENADGPLPAGRTLTVYRGQRPGDPIGIAWTLLLVVAERFAKGASFRAPIKNGIVLEAQVPRSAILAYLTSRNEAEVILDPTHLKEIAR